MGWTIVINSMFKTWKLFVYLRFFKKFFKKIKPGSFCFPYTAYKKLGIILNYIPLWLIKWVIFCMITIRGRKKFRLYFPKSLPIAKRRDWRQLILHLTHVGSWSKSKLSLNLRIIPALSLKSFRRIKLEWGRPAIKISNRSDSILKMMLKVVDASNIEPELNFTLIFLFCGVRRILCVFLRERKYLFIFLEIIFNSKA